jgi:hypothetical protein
VWLVVDILTFVIFYFGTGGNRLKLGPLECCANGLYDVVW